MKPSNCFVTTSTVCGTTNQQHRGCHQISILYIDRSHTSASPKSTTRVPVGRFVFCPVVCWTTNQQRLSSDNIKVIPVLPLSPNVAHLEDSSGQFQRLPHLDKSARLTIRVFLVLVSDCQTQLGPRGFLLTYPISPLPNLSLTIRNKNQKNSDCETS